MKEAHRGKVVLYSSENLNISSIKRSLGLNSFNIEYFNELKPLIKDFDHNSSIFLIFADSSLMTLIDILEHTFGFRINLLPVIVFTFEQPSLLINNLQNYFIEIHKCLQESILIIIWLPHDEVRRIKSNIIHAQNRYNKKDIKIVSSNIYQEIVERRASQVSREFFRDFEHTLINKMLPNIKINLGIIKSLRYQVWFKGKIYTLFSNQITELCGIDIPKIFMQEIKQIKYRMERIDELIQPKVFVEVDRMQKILADIINNCLSLPRQQTFQINYEKEKQNLSYYFEKLKVILNDIWRMKFGELSEMKQLDVWKRLKPNVTEYYKIRIGLEITLWKLSVWLPGRNYKAYLELLFNGLLDPLIERVEHKEFDRVNAIFNPERLNSLKFSISDCFSDFFMLEGDLV